MPIYTFDTSIIITYRVRELPQNFLLSAVVIAELTAGAPDDSTRKVFEAMRRDYDKLDALIVPTSDDWLTASRILFWLSGGRKKRSGGKRPPLLPGASQRMFLDTLIAVSAAHERDRRNARLGRFQSYSVLLRCQTEARR